MGGVWCLYIRTAASSPAWLTRSALSRNCCCSLVRGRRRLAVVPDLRASGAGSVFGDSGEVVIDA